MKLDIQVNDDDVLAVLEEPRMDAALAVDFRKRMLEAIGDGKDRVAIDLAAVSFIDSSGLGALVSVLRAVGRRGELFLCGVQENVASVFELTRMNQVFTFKPDASDFG